MNDNAGEEKYECCFCGSAKIRRIRTNIFHPRKRDHGPFEFYECELCGSGLTLPSPSNEMLRCLYESFSRGLPEEIRILRGAGRQSAWYRQCIRHARRRLPRRKQRNFSWIDVGAGGGELAMMLAEIVPAAIGMAIDLHETPEPVMRFPQVQWRRIDPGDAVFAQKLGGSADLVFSVSVLEHVIHPDVFLENLLRLVSPGGVMYLACPDYGSPASRLLRSRWPFFLPGEHLNMPTSRGMMRAVMRALRRAGRSNARTSVRTITLPYTLQYALRFSGFWGVAHLLPERWIFPLPAGAMEAIVEFPGS